MDIQPEGNFYTRNATVVHFLVLAIVSSVGAWSLVNTVYGTQGEAQVAATSLSTTCTPAAPLITVTPSMQTGTAGTGLWYHIDLLNRDSAACASTVFNLEYVLPDGWYKTYGETNVATQPGSTTPIGFGIYSASSTSSGTYGIGIEVTDVAQNSVHATSTYVTYAVSNDSKSPVVTITSPKDGSKVKTKVSVSAQATDASGISQMTLQLDKPFQPNYPYRCFPVLNGVCSVNWNTQTWAKGSHTITATAWDSVGNVSSTTITIVK